jgi:hypothetical protein
MMNFPFQSSNSLDPKRSAKDCLRRNPASVESFPLAKPLALFLLLALIGSVPGNATAIGYTWTGASMADSGLPSDQRNLEWQNPRNWKPNGVPGSGDSATISNASVRLTSSVTIKDLNLNGTTAASDCRLSGPSDTGMSFAALTITGIFTWSGVGIVGQDHLIALNLMPGAQLRFTGGASTGQAESSKGIATTINNEGTITWSGADLTSHFGPATVNNSGSFTARSNIGFGSDSEQSPVVFNNKGTYTQLPSSDILGPTRFYGPGEFNNTGTVDVQTEILTLGGTHESRSSGLFKAASGTRIEFTGNHTLLAGASLTGGGFYRIATQASGGRVDLRAPLPVQPNLVLLDGILQGEDGSSLKGSGKLSWQGGAMKGNVQIEPGFKVELTGAAAKSLEGALTNAGTLTWSGTGNLIASGASGLVNSGTIDLQGDASLISDAGSTFSLLNSGTLKKTGGAGTSVVSSPNPMQNSGTVEVDSGTLSFHSPSWVQTGGSTFLRRANIEVLKEGIPASFDLQGGTLSGIGTLTAHVQNRAEVHPASSDFTGALTLNGNYVQSPEGTLTIDVGPVPNSPPYVPLQINGNAALSGALTVQGTPGFTADFGTILKNAVSFGSHTGQFTNWPAKDFSAGRIFRPSIGSGVDVVFGAEVPLAVGANVTALAGDAKVFFPNVAQNGVLTVFPVERASLPPPVGVTLPNKGLARDIGVEATFDSPVRVCLPIPFELQSSGLQLYHLEGDAWVNRTVSPANPAEVCAEASSPGVFAQGIAGSVKSGDLDGDGKVTVQDAILALRSIVGLVQLTPDQISTADRNGDGKLRIQEVNAILRRALGVG